MQGKLTVRCDHKVCGVRFSEDYLKKDGRLGMAYS